MTAVLSVLGGLGVGALVPLAALAVLAEPDAPVRRRTRAERLLARAGARVVASSRGVVVAVVVGLVVGLAAGPVLGRWRSRTRARWRGAS